MAFEGCPRPGSTVVLAMGLEPQSRSEYTSRFRNAWERCLSHEIEARAIKAIHTPVTYVDAKRQTMG